jgi:hypothetical protein
MPASGLLLRVALVRTDVTEERPFFREPHGVTSQKTAFFNFIFTVVKNIPEESDANPTHDSELIDTRYTCLMCTQTPWPLVRERTIPTERPPLVDEI